MAIEQYWRKLVCVTAVYVVALYVFYFFFLQLPDNRSPVPPSFRSHDAGENSEASEDREASEDSEDREDSEHSEDSEDSEGSGGADEGPASPTTTAGPTAADRAAAGASPGQHHAVQVQVTTKGSPTTTPTATTTKHMRCQLRVCNLHPPSSPVLYTVELFEGAGHRLANIVNGMAVAAHNKMNFGGVVPQRGVTEHGIDFRELVDKFFGGQHGVEASMEIFVENRTDFAFLFRGVRAMEEKRHLFQKFDKIYIYSPFLWDYGPNYDSGSEEKGLSQDYWTYPLKASLLGPVMTWPIKFSPAKAWVAVHVRRGDLPRDALRVVKDGYYHYLVNLVRERIENPDVHVWSSIGPGMSGEQHWFTEDFDGYVERGMVVHLDEDYPVHIWAHLARAKVFITSPSFFSYIPAMLNPFCVVYPGKVSHWLNGYDIQGPKDYWKLDECLARQR